MQTSQSKCLVTGGAGFIGSHVAHRLVELGHKVRVLDNLSTGSRENLDELTGRVELLVGDVQDPDACARAVDGVEIVFHLAALGSVPRSLADAWGSHDANVNGTVRLLEASRAAGVRRVVYSSSSSVYGDTPTLPKVESVEPLPRSPYAASKLAGEQYVLAYARAGLLEGVALRYFNVFGPRDDPHGPYATAVPKFLLAALLGVPAEVHGAGIQTRDFTYVDNVVEANLLAAFGPAERVNGAVVNTGTGQRASLLELLELVHAVTGQRPPVTHGPPRAGDVRDTLASLERAEAVLGYRPAVALREGLERTWAWMSARSALAEGASV